MQTGTWWACRTLPWALPRVVHHRSSSDQLEIFDRLDQRHHDPGDFSGSFEHMKDFRNSYSLPAMTMSSWCAALRRWSVLPALRIWTNSPTTPLIDWSSRQYFPLNIVNYIYWRKWNSSCISSIPSYNEQRCHRLILVHPILQGELSQLIVTRTHPFVITCFFSSAILLWR